ncbi:MAG: RNA 2',3'-cyclic phosphodiesterase [Thermomicrobiales bacterium]
MAVPISHAIRQTIIDIQDELAGWTLPMRWVNPELSHITLKFLGDTNPRRIRDIAGKLDWAAGRSEPMVLETDIVGGFPNSRRPRVVWLGLAGATVELERLADDVDEVAVELGYEAERRGFKPHITIGRLRRGYDPPEDFELAARELVVPSLKLHVDRIQLYQSVLAPGGPHYSVIDEWRLGQEARTPRALDHG